MKKVICAVLMSVLVLNGCGANLSEADTVNASGKIINDDNDGDYGNNGDYTGNDGAGSGRNDTNNSTKMEAVLSRDVSDIFTDRDYEIGYDENTSVLIRLDGDSISCNSDSVKVSGTTATITNEGTYILSGTLDDGMIIVNAGDKDKLHLVLNDVNINSEISAPIYILEADKVFITLAADTSNTLSNGGSFTAIDGNNIDSVIFSKQDLTLNGSGHLTVTSPTGHGIVSKDDLVFTSGTYTINSAFHGMDANDSVRIVNAKIAIDAGKDGIHAENSDNAELGFVYIASGTLDISAEGDGISAGAYMQINDGNFTIVSGGGNQNAVKQRSDSWGRFKGDKNQYFYGELSIDDESSTSIKAIKAAGNLLINNGTFYIDSADDAVHSNSSIVVNGGNFEIASGDDGFHADEVLTITAGTIDITESYEGLEALNLEISGGDITLTASDDGLNAAGGMDASGFGGPRGNDNFGGRRGNGGFGDKPGDFGDNDDFGYHRGNGGFGGDRGAIDSSSEGSMVISGGNLYIKAFGDGLDANGTLEITGGNITVCGPIQGDTATLDYDVSGVIIGGTFIGTGAAGMAQSLSSSEQGVIAVKVGNQSADTQITLTDRSGNTIISHTPELPFAVVILSSPEIVKGETYTLSVGDSSEDYCA